MPSLAPQPLWAHPESLVPGRTAEKPPKRSLGKISFGGSDPSLPGYVEIGAHTYYVPRQTRFLGYIPGEKIIIGKYCSLALEVTIFVGGNHTTETVSTYPFDTWFLDRMNPTRSYKTTRNTEIGSDVWVGHGAHIAGGVHIGHGAVIASQAVVFTDVPPYGIAVGNPARVNRFRFSESIVESLLRIAWWDWPDEVVRRNVEWFYRPIAEFVKHFDPLGESSGDVEKRTNTAPSNGQSSIGAGLENKDNPRLSSATLEGSRPSPFVPGHSSGVPAALCPNPVKCIARS